MSWFGLDRESTLARAKARGVELVAPSLAASVARGMVGTMFLSVAGFAPWALAGGWLHRRVGEFGMYLVCALAFIGLCGPALHRLILGPGSLSRFYKVFTVIFSAYSAAWIAGWMGLQSFGGHVASLSGLGAGTALMAWLLTRAFGEAGAALKSFAALFVLNTLGYYVGGWAEGRVAHLSHLSLAGIVVEKPPPAPVAMLLWGVAYGLGLGAGLGLAFHFCQKTLRQQIARS